SSSFADEASHMFFGSALNFSSLFATHPPLEDRIARISPSLLQGDTWVSRRPEAADDSETAGLISKIQPSVAPRSRGIDEIMASVGAPQARDLEAACTLIQSLNPELRDELHRVEHAREILCALLLEPGGGSVKQHVLIREALGESGLAQTLRFLELMGEDGRQHRLSILQLALPAFRAFEPIPQRAFLVLARELVFADQKFDLFEYVALTIIESQTDSRNRRAARLKPTKRDVSLVLSALAYSGSSNVTEAKKAFEAGLLAFNEKSKAGLEFCPPDVCKFEHLSPSVWRLAHAFPDTKKGLIEASARVIMADGKMAREENELLHAVCAVLEAPLPVMAVG
ncbi:MAG: hypothetical protein V4760_05660, partial [Bdellovibrionota bacterium]